MNDMSEAPDSDSDIERQFALTDEEAVVLAAAKLWLMEEDLAGDPDLGDRSKKAPIVEGYISELHLALRAASEGIEADSDSSREALDRIGDPRWVSGFSRYLGDLSRDDARRELRSWALMERLLTTVSRRDRAVMLIIELAAFHPWPSGVKYERGLRERNLSRLVEAMAAPVGSDYLRQLDDELRRRARRFARKGINWTRFGVVAAGGAVLGAITGGLAAPLVGAAIGSTMGLSGAAASSAGLALLGGGSIAAGGLGMAGGTALVSASASLGSLGLASGVAWWRETSSNSVLTDAVKLDVLTEYVILREQTDSDKARLIIRRTEARLSEAEEEVAALRARVESLTGVIDERDRTRDELEKVKQERDELTEQLADLRKKNHYLQSLADDLKARVDEFEEGDVG
jgi:hypothetical protein